MVDKIKHYSMTNPASIYDEEALTALELSARTAGKVNECIDAVNDIPEIVEDDIENVLNSGRFDVLLDRKTNGLVSRVDSLLSRTPTGSTTMDNEIVDARQDADGYTHPNLGSAVRDASKQVEREISRFVAVNRLDPGTAVPGYLQGYNVMESETYVTSDYIAVKPGETIGLFYKDMTPVPFRFISLYNKTKGFIAPANKTNVLGYTVPNGTGFIRVTIEPKSMRTADYMIASADASTWVSYGEATIAESSIPDTVRNASEKLVYTNRYASSYEEKGVYVNYTTGLLQANPDYTSTGFIRVTPGEKLCFYNEGVSVIPVRMGAFFDLSGTYLSGFSVSTNQITVPAGAHYMRVSVHKDYYGHLMMTEPGAYKFLEPGEVCVKKGVFDVEASKRPKTAIVRSSLVSDGSKLTIPDFPKYISGDFTMNFTAFVNAGSNPSLPATLLIGKGGEEAPEYGSEWFELKTGQLITVHEYADGFKSSSIPSSAPSFGGLQVAISLTVKDGKYDLRIYSIMPGQVRNTTNSIARSFAGVPFVKIVNGSLTNVSFSISANLDADVWLFGDSYLGWASNRVCGALSSTFSTSGMLVDAMSGQISEGAYHDLVRALNYGKPKTLVWYLGMNDQLETYQQYLNYIEELCDKEGIELVVNATPSPSSSLDKSALATLARSSGRRIIASDTTVGGSRGGIDTDGVHPTASGAIFLASELLASVPELTKYKEV